MSNDEKMCPLTKMTCYGAACGWWNTTSCAVIGIARDLNSVGKELFQARLDLTLIRMDVKEHWMV